MNMLISLGSQFGVYILGALGFAGWLWRRSLKDKEAGRAEVRTEATAAELDAAFKAAGARKHVAAADDAERRRMQVKYTRK
jgi:hypothetical protein